MATKHSLIQERLNLKRAPLDEWNTHEQLCLASAVACSGDQNWMSVSRSLKGIVNSGATRPTDWFVSKSCATQYGKLLESVETPKRKKRTASERDQPMETPSTPVESLVKKLTMERIIELKRQISDEQKEYLKLKQDIDFLEGPSMDERRIRLLWADIEQEKIQKEREQQRYTQWLQEREEKKLEIERQWRPYKARPLTAQPAQSSTSEDPGTPTTPSPLLTSLLKSQVAASAPTITNLLTGTPSPSSTSSSTSHSSSVMLLPINHSASVQIPVSQSAPTLVTLLDKKPTPLVDPAINEKQQLMMSIDVSETGGKDGDGDGEEDDLLADIGELIAEKFDEEDLEDINSIIMNPEILEDKMQEDEGPIKDENEVAGSELRIQKLVDVLVGEEGKEVGNIIPIEQEVIQVPSDIENSNSASEETVEKVVMEVESPPEDKVMMISDDSEDAKKETEPEDEKVEDVEEETKSDMVKDEDSKGVQESDDSSEKETKEPPTTVFAVEDSDEDAMFEDAKDHHDESNKEPDTSNEPAEASEAKEPEVKAPSSIDTDDEVLGVKASRSASRKKAVESTPVDDLPIRTRSRHSSTITSNEPKSSYNFSKEQDHSMWKARWDDCAKELMKHRDYTSIVDNKIFNDDSFRSVIFCSTNMKSIQKNIENHVSTMPSDVKRDFVMMCTNIIMWNKKGAKFNENIRQFINDGMEIIDNHLGEVEDTYKSYRKQIKKKN